MINIAPKSANPGIFNIFEQGIRTQNNYLVGDGIIDNQKVDFIKIDVEGYESFVIEGLMGTINRHKPKIIFEYGKQHHHKTGRLYFADIS